MKKKTKEEKIKRALSKHMKKKKEIAVAKYNSI